MKGQITISRRKSTKSGDYLSITVKDDKSGVEFLEVQMTLTDFAYAITGQGFIACDFELFAQNVGKRRVVAQTGYVGLRQNDCDSWVMAINGHILSPQSDRIDMLSWREVLKGHFHGIEIEIAR